MDSEYPHHGHESPLLEELHTAAAELNGALDHLEAWLAATVGDATEEHLPEQAVHS